MSVIVTVKVEMVCDHCGAIGMEDDRENLKAASELVSLWKNQHPDGWKHNAHSKKLNMHFEHICDDCQTSINKGK